MHIYISICITLLTLIAAMHLLLKANTQQVSSLFKWISYLIVTVGLLILVCQVVRGVMMMRHHDNDRMEHSHMFMRHHGMGNMDCCMGMKGQGGMRCCEMDEEKGECCEEMMSGDSSHMKVETKVYIDKDGEKQMEEKPEKK